MRTRRHQRRGGMYLAVLMTALIVAVIGLSGLTLSRIQLRSAEGEREIVSARFYAQSAIEMALFTINADPSWRTTQTHELWTPAQPIGEGTYAWMLADEWNGDLAMDPSAPVRVYGLGSAGEAVRLYSVLIQEDQTGGGSNLLSNPGMENGTADWEDFGDCDLETKTDGPHGGLAYMQVKSRDNHWAGPRQSLGDAISEGTEYQAEVWVKMKDFSESAQIRVWLQTSYGWDVIDAGVTLAGTDWTKISGTFTPYWSGTLLDTIWKVETDWSTQEFKVDDTLLAETGAASGPSLSIRPGSWRREVLP